ncbi:hypothetical protein RHMOL_Rhmol07G0181900 [Rhododendron molle]|uniref:Uncharacterized protein n=1 Tax=Rhododendron molle TaxID=49168 RepID=A0ACC0N3L6_RHOML|nr:hypothetical protein RHMOL_Rhmol07G0181900 [Rhododendron molle]
MGDTIATLFIHFRGKLVEEPQLSYIGGRVATFSIIDKVSYFDIVDIIYELRCPRHIKVFYQLLEISANKSLGELQCDTNVMELFTMYGEGAEVNIYVHDPFSIEGDSENEYGISGVETRI